MSTQQFQDGQVLTAAELNAFFDAASIVAAIIQLPPANLQTLANALAPYLPLGGGSGTGPTYAAGAGALGALQAGGTATNAGSPGTDSAQGSPSLGAVQSYGSVSVGGVAPPDAASGSASLGQTTASGTVTNSGVLTNAMTVGGEEMTIGGQPITV